MRKPLIQLKSITKEYSAGGAKVLALRQVSLNVYRGDFLTIIGPSGSGKSTLLNIIGCIDTFDDGSYCLMGKRIESYSESQLATIRNRRIGFIFQSFNLLERQSIRKNVELPLIYRNLSPSKRKSKALYALDQVGLSGKADSKPYQLSGGQQQRAAIARAIVTNPEILLADEPTGNLDTDTGFHIMKALSNINQTGTTVILITHNNEIARYGNRIVQIIDGSLNEVSL